MSLPQGGTLKSGGKVGEVFFVLDKDASGRAFVLVTDAKGNEVQVDYRLYSGERFILLRALDSIRREQSSTISWGSISSPVYIDEHPHLIYQILRAPGVLDASLRKVKVRDEGTYRMTLTLIEDGEEYVPSFSLEPEDDEPALSHAHTFMLLTDSYALSDDLIVEVQPLGENYSRLDLFTTRVHKTLCESYLSILLSNFDNIDVMVGDRTTVIGEEPLTLSPSVVFEKVDEDQALYLRVMATAPSVDPLFIRDYSPTRLVTLTPDGNTLIRKVEYPDLSPMNEDLLGIIKSFAPSKTAAKDIYEEGGFFIVPSETAGPFLLGGLHEVVSKFEVLGTDKLFGYKVRQVTPKLSISVSSGIDFLEGAASVNLDGDVFTLLDFLRQYRRNRYLSLSNGDKAIIDEDWVKRLERLVSKSRDNNVKVSFFDLPEVTQLLSEPLECEIMHRSRDFYEGFNALRGESLHTPSGFKAKLRPYQKEGVKWMKYLYDNGFGGCLADDMGLGKTVQTIALLSLIYPAQKTPSLIVMPRSLIFNWASEFGRFAPEMKVGIYHGAGRDLATLMAENQVVLTTYAIVRNDVEKFIDIPLHYVILDESQNIKNMAALSTRAVMLLRAEHRLALSGTPLENNLMELYSLFRFLNPTMFGTPEDFSAKYATPIQRNSDDEAMDSLRRKIFPFLLRRLKKDVLKDLPDRVDQTLYIEMEPKHALFYEQKRQMYYSIVKESISKGGVGKSQFIMLQALTELRRIASIPESLSDGVVKSSKIPTLTDSVSEAVFNGHKVVVFFNFIAGIELTGAALEEQGIGYVVMTGATTDRESIVGRFQRDPSCKVLLATLKTGGVGLNLTAADIVYIVEPWWNKAAEMQAVNRLHRIGQTAKVHAFSLVTKDTIEEKILLLQQQKAELFESLISSDSSSSKVLTEEDIEFILG